MNSRSKAPLSTWLAMALVGFISLASGRVYAQAQALPAATPRATVDWLKVLVLEGRLEVRSGATAGPRLFRERVSDGRTWMEYIADTLGAAAGGDPAQPLVTNEWALLDEAVSVLLAEADTMKALAAQRSGAAANSLHEARRNYLTGAARLLSAYKVAAGDVFESFAGPLVGVPELPDWAFPGEIRLKEIAGAARLNTQTRAYAGRLSGRLEFPGWNASLSVPNASFDGSGRMDLSAYGTLTFNGGSLAIPARKPLRVRRTADGKFAIAGDARLTLNNGLRFDATMSLADPIYCFGLSARGLEFDLGRSMLVRVPALAVGQVNAFSDEARDAFADYFRGLNGAAETLLTAVTNFPPIDETQFGQPPEFVTPELNLDVSVLNAWSSEIIARTRAGLSNAQQSLQPMLDSLRRLNETARASTNAIADERSRMMNLAARMEVRRKMKAALELAAQQQAITEGATAVADFRAQAVAGAREEGRLITTLVTPDLPDRLGESVEVARLLLDMEGLWAELGQPPSPAGTIPADVCAACTNAAANYVQRASALVQCAVRRLAVRHGLNPSTGAATNTAIFNALSEADLYRLARTLSDIAAESEAQGVTLEGGLATLLPTLLSRQQELLLEELGRTSALPRIFELASLLTENYQDAIQADMAVEGNELVALMEEAVGSRLQGVPPAVLDQARAEAQRGLASRRRELRDDVEYITGRRRHVGLVPAGDHYQPDILTQFDQFFRIVNLPVPPVMGGSLDQLVRFKVAELRARPFTAEFLTNRLADGQNLLSLVIGLTDWADRRFANDSALIGDLRFGVTNLTFSLVGAAEVQRAWWWIDRYQDAFRLHAATYGTNVQAGLVDAERKSRDAALLAARRVAGAFSNLVSTLVTAQDLRVPLPGNVEIKRIFGRLCYNRLNGQLGGCFGGRLEFPDLGPDIFFEISQACLNTDGSYSISAASAGPLPFGRMRLTSSMDVNGSPSGVASFSGSGTLNLDTGAGFGAGPSVSVDIEYDSARRALAVGAATSQLRLGEQAAVLNGSVLAEFATDHPAGALTIEGRLGFLARAPIPTNRAMTETDFWLVIDAQPTRFLYTTNDFTAEFTGGTITLPPDLFSTNAPPNARPVTVAITSRLCLRYDFVQNRLEFCGNPNQPFVATLQNLNLQLPELPGFGLGISLATLELSGTQFPRLKNLNASLTLPLPGRDAANTNLNRNAVIAITAQNWRLDGLPEAATIALGSDLRLVDDGGFTVDLLSGSGLGLSRTGSGANRAIRYTLTGNMRVGFSEQVLRDDASGTAARFSAGGSFAWDMRSAPSLVLSLLQFEGNFRLGAEGPRITGLQAGGLARLTFAGLENLFQQSPQRPVNISLEGAVEVPDVIKFGLLDTKFILDGSGLRFLPGGAQVELGNQSVELQDALPVYLRKAGLAFKNPALPLLPGPGQTGLFDLANLTITISGGVNLPNKTALDAGAPGFAGEVNDLAMSLRRDAQNHLLPVFSLNGLGVELKNVDIPPLGALTGGLYVGNLNDPDNLYFAGTVSGTVNDIGAGVTMAVHRQKGLLGACFELDVGPAGVPIDGGTLGGILLTGGKGGLSFGNQFADPCDFRSYIQFTEVNGVKQPANDGTADSFNPTGSPVPPQVPPSPPPASPGANSCIVGEFPPSTINPLCEPHPSIANRIIFKGTALSSAQLANLGFTSATCPRTLKAAVDFAVDKIAQPLRSVIGALTNAVPPTVPAETKGYYTDLLLKQLHQLENTASSILASTLGDALATNPNASLYNAIVTAAGQGIPCLDATLKLQGNFSHAAVSTVLKGEGAVVVSTTGTALMQGAIKLVGIPIGEGTLAFSLTDSRGNINPSFGGVINAGVGPLTLGDMSVVYECEGCFDVVISAFGSFLQSNANNLGGDARALLVTVMNRSVPLAQPRPVDGNLLAFYNALKPRQRLGFVVSLFNLTDLAASGGSLPGISRQTALGFLGSFRHFVTEVATQVNPRFCFQAKVKPALFGFPLIPGPTPLDARFGYERVVDDATGDEFQQLSANAVFSPAFILGSLTTGSLAMLAPSSDQANFGFSFRMPAFTPEKVEMALGNPGQFATDQFTTLLQDSVMTFGYAFMPLGIPLAEGQARVILPRLANHPTNPQRAGGAWRLPAGNGVATREDIIIAALVRQRLQDPNWRGQRGELDDLFAPITPPPPPGSAMERLAVVSTNINRTTMAQFGLAEDYFPHGGIIGASRLDLPSVIAQAPPLELIGRVFDFANPNWVTDAQNLFNNYLTANTSIGQMALFIPAPNPPFGFNFTTNTADALLKAISRADALSIIQRSAPGGVYPFDQVLLSGWLKAQLLGMPLGEGLVRYTNGHFQARVAVSSGTWLSDFIGASADLEIRPPALLGSGAPTGGSIEQMYAGVTKQTIQEMFAARAAQITGTPTVAFISNTVDMIERTLPKASVEMAANVQIPGYLRPILQANAAVTNTFFAFSPAFDPSFGRNGPGAADDDNSPYAVAKRRGGLGLKGSFDLGLNLQDADPNNDLRIRINDASFSLTPDAQIGAFPALNGQLLAGDINLPFMPRLRDGRVNFSSSPDNLAPYFSVAGRIEPFEILIPNAFGQAIPLAQFKARGGPGAFVGGTLTVFKDSGVPIVGAGGRLEIEPMRVNMPLLGPDVAMTIYGTQNGSVFTPFRFSSSPGDRWSATVKIHAASNENGPPVFGICDPRTVTQDGQGNWVGDPASCAMAFGLTAPVVGSMEGTGFDRLRLAISLPRLSNVVFFPNTAMRTEVATMGSGASSGLIMIEKSPGDGLPRFYVDFGTNNVGLPGVLSATGRFEFGYNPTNTPGSIVAGPSSLSFGSLEICSPNPIVRTLSITNRSSEPANVLVRVADPTNYTVAASQFALARNGGFRTVDVLFHPRTAGTRNSTLIIEGDNAPTVNVPLSGTGTATPRYFQSRDSIGFGDTVAGQVASATVLVANEGCGNLTVNGVSLSGSQASAFSVTPAGSVTLGPGQSRLYRVEFAPTAVPLPPATSVPHAATLTVSTAITNRTLALSGNATESRWVTLMDAQQGNSTSKFNSVLMLDNRQGWVVGDGGTVYETQDGGRSWRSRILTPFNLRSVNAERTLTTPVLAAYHFEEPPEALIYRDDGPGAFHARAETQTATTAPTNSLEHGQFGSGLGFDGSNDSAYIAGSLALPASASVAFWFRPDSITASDVLVGQTDTLNNGTVLSVETAGSSGYRVRFGGQSFSGGSILSGWQHVAVTFAFNATSNLTTARFYRNGLQLWTTNFSGTWPTAGSPLWGLGARYQTASLRASLFGGALDELYFFSGVLSSTEITALGTGAGGFRLMIVGDEGTVLQSETLGRTWHKPFDLNPDGWRQRDGVYFDYDWYDVVVGGSADKIVVAGTRKPTSGITQFNNGVVMVEDLYPGLPLVAGDERFDEVNFAGSTINAVDVAFLAVVRNSSDRVYGFTHGGRVYQSNGSNLTNDWIQHGTLDLGLPLNDATMVGSSSYVAVGNGGTMVRSASGAAPDTMVSGVTNHLRGISWVGSTAGTVPELHAVGDGGVYLHSADLGLNWTRAADGLTGNNRSISARIATNGGYEAWAAGEDHRIQYRTPQPLTNAFLTFHPGELDFGMLTLGESRTRPLELRNRGKRDLQISQLAITGTGFSLVQAGVNRIAPGDTMTVQVRFKPATETALAQGNLVIRANDGSAPLNVPLVGRASGLEWQPVTLVGSSGTPINGDVIDLAFTSATTGYALLAGSVLKTINGGQSWTSVGPTSGSVLVNHVFRSLDARRVGGVDVIYVAGNTFHLTGFPQTRGAIWRSGDGGASWAARTPPSTLLNFHPPFGDIAMLHDDANAVVCVGSDPAGHAADVWQSTDGGASWATKLRPPDEIVTSTTNASFNGGRVLIEEIQQGAVPASAGWVVIATDGSAVYSRGFNDEWEYVETFPTESGRERLQFDQLQPIKAMQFGRAPALASSVLETGWLIGAQGLFWRWTPTPPNGSPFAGSEGEWIPAANQEVFGRTDLEAMSFVRYTNGPIPRFAGWVVGGSKVFATRDSGASWALDYDAGESNRLRSAFSVSPTNAWVGGSLGGRATVWRYRPGAVPTRGILSVNDVELFTGTILPGTTNHTRSVTIQNIGNAALNLQHIGIESSDPLSRFRIVGSAPTALAAGASSAVSVAFDALPDSIDLESLAPLTFHRFEQGFTDTTFFDAGPLHVDIRLDGTNAVAVTNRPRILHDPLRRDRSLSFDGDDYASLSASTQLDNFPGDFSLALWVNPETTADNQAFLGKHGATGGNRLVFGFYAGGYQLNLRDITLSAPGKRAGWQHLAVTGQRTATNSTVVTIYRDGEVLAQSNLVQVLGNAAGLPWILGGEWDGTIVSDRFRGDLDDVAIFGRLLTESEIQALAAKSPVCGDHVAKLVFQTDSESGERSTELRASVDETGGAVLIETVPSGATVTVDGVPYPTPVTFAVGCTASTPKEWLEGSQHTIVAPSSVALIANASTLNYGFSEWSLQNASTTTLFIVARTNLGRITARYRLDGIQSGGAGGGGGEMAGAGGEPLFQAAGFPPDLGSVVAGTPAGPWFRISNGRLDLPNLGGNGFNITGELFGSLSRMKGSLTSTPLNWPATGSRLLELGAGEWQLDAVAGSHFRMRTRPPSLAILGHDVAPDGEFRLDFDLQANAYAASFDLRQDFRPAPNFFEIARNATGRAGVTMLVGLPSGQAPTFALTVDGRVRVLKLPAGLSGQGTAGWAVERDVAFNVNSADFNLSLRNDIVGAAQWPATLFNGGVFALSAGDVRLARANNGPIVLLMTNLSLSLNGQTAATVSGSVSTDTALNLNGTVAGNTDLRLLNGGRFALRSRNGGALSFTMGLRALPTPRFQLNLPAMKLLCSPGGSVDPLEVNLPAIDFDSAGTFDTGKLALPGSLVFDGINVEKPSGADLDKNYLRLRRDAAGKVVFNFRAQQKFEAPGISCRNDLKVTIDNGLSASYRGNFCVLPEPISLNFNGASACQFSGSAFGQTIFFGTGCVGVLNDATGVCLGTCQ